MALRVAATSSDWIGTKSLGFRSPIPQYRILGAFARIPKYTVHFYWNNMLAYALLSECSSTLPSSMSAE